VKDRCIVDNEATGADPLPALLTGGTFNIDNLSSREKNTPWDNI